MWTLPDRPLPTLGVKMAWRRAVHCQDVVCFDGCGSCKCLAVLTTYQLCRGDGAVSKTGVVERPPWVRIPPSPPHHIYTRQPRASQALQNSSLHPVIEFRRAKFSYGDRWILDDVRFEVMRGETLLVLSASGGGKSTILKLAMGLIKPNSGQVLVGGDDITGIRVGLARALVAP